MREPAFWWRDGAAGTLLAPLGALYGAVTGARMRRAGADAGVPVVCIGNLTLGGSGKTPTAIALAYLLREARERPFILTRGYGGREAGPLLVAAGMAATAVGDEPLLLAHAAPTVVSRDRPAGAAFARAQGASIIVMDDGLQNPSLRKTLSIAVIDGRRGIGTGRVFPAGPLRAPLAAQLDHIHALLVIGGPDGADDVTAIAAARGLAVFHAALTPDADAVARLRGRRLFAFAGIGDPDKFFATLAQAGLTPAGRRAFPDHHRYSTRDAAALIEAARRDGLELVTTEKDAARLAGDPARAELKACSAVLPVTLALEEPQRFSDFVLSRLRA